ncbi:alpha/beta hydrolase family protein [Pseudonocardia sp. DLS-67]
MRPLEASLLTAIVLAFVVLVVCPGRARHLRLLALLPLPALAAQVLVEGARWQMIPAYVLSGLAALGWLTRPAGRPPGRGVAVGLGVLGLAVAIAVPVVVPVFRLPVPTGPYAVGTQTYHWVDAGRPDVFTADPDDRRELVVQVWYPAADEPSAPRAPYVADGRALAPLARLMKLPGPTFDYFDQVRTNAVAGAPAVREDTRYPVLIFSHGRGGYRQHNTAQVEELVSHGYVVAAIDHPHASAGVIFPDGRQVDMDPRMLDRPFIDTVIPFLAQDASFTLDRLADVDHADDVLAGRLDLDHVGMFGVSLGGAVTGEACKNDPRIGACLPIDVFLPAEVVSQGLHQPVMWISRDAGTMRREGWSESDVEETHRTMRAVYDRLSGPGYIVLVPGMYHVDFSDFPLFSPMLAKPLGLSGSLDPQRAREIPDAYAQAFFDKHLKGRPAPLLDGPSARFPEVLFESR